MNCEIKRQRLLRKNWRTWIWELGARWELVDGRQVSFHQRSANRGDGAEPTPL